MYKFLLATAAMFLANLAPCFAGSTRSDDEGVVIEATSDWQLSAVEASEQVEKQILLSFASLLSLYEGEHGCPRFRGHVHLILQEENLLRTADIETRRRAYGEQVRLVERIIVPNTVIDHHRNTWRRIAARQRLVRAGVYLSMPFILPVAAFVFVILDRITYGDRRRVLAPACLLMVGGTVVALLQVPRLLA